MSDQDFSQLSRWERSKVYDAEIPRFAEQGATKSLASDVIGTNSEALRMAAARRGFVLTAELNRSVREYAESMKPMDAVDYLLGVLEQLEIVAPRDVTHAEARVPDTTRQEARVLNALYEFSPKTLSKEAVFTAMFFDRPDADDLPEMKIVDVVVCKLRKKIPSKFGSIETDWGFGYRFVQFQEQTNA